MQKVLRKGQKRRDAARTTAYWGTLLLLMYLAFIAVKIITAL